MRPSPTPLLAARGASRAFGGVPALSDVTLELFAGETHALLGENGAGKSTLLKILCGALRPDAGTLELDGAPVVFPSPQAALRRGVVAIHQEFSLFPNLSVAENVTLGHAPRTAAGLISWSSMEARARAVLDRLGLAIDPRRQVAELSVAEQQLVEIARALSLESRVLIMDEPTAALSPREVARLGDLVAGLKARGLAVVFVSHRLDEVKALCDRYTVLRDGVRVGTGPLAEVGVEGLVQLMIGRPLFDAADASSRAPGEVVLEVRGLSTVRGRGARGTPLQGVSLEARAGEILGLAGLVGAGRTELVRAVFGADRPTRGEVRVGGVRLRPGAPRDAIRAGVGLVPEDRKQQALFLSLAVSENLVMAGLRRLRGRLGLLDRAREAAEVARSRTALDIRMAGPGQPVRALSGGNQQKVVLARWLALSPRVLLVDEPTRGIDVAAKAEVHHLLFALARRGVAVVVVSSELSELSGLADRVIALRDGRVTGELARGEVSEARLLQLIAGFAGAPQPAA
jgi:ABC-type sugar transport system ATPase subunit